MQAQKVNLIGERLKYKIEVTSQEKVRKGIIIKPKWHKMCIVDLKSMVGMGINFQIQDSWNFKLFATNW